MNIRALPLFVYMLFSVITLMLVPASFAALTGDLASASVFGFSALVLLTITITISLAVVNRKPTSTGRLHLITLLMAYLFLPLVCALPFSNLIPSISISQAYFEMMSCFTTTGATLFDTPSDLSDTLHLWRSIVAWFGGYVTLVAALAIMEPLSLGGFEIRANSARSEKYRKITPHGKPISASDRIIRAIVQILPLYVGLTAVLAFILMVLGDRGFVAVLHAMAIISTSGISPVGGLEQSQSGFWGEAVILCFLFAALSHRLFIKRKGAALGDVLEDPELRLGLMIVLLVSTVLVIFHFAGVGDENVVQSWNRTFNAWWGGFFTSLSFLTTTGFVSDQWAVAKVWANLDNTGLILLCLALMGGGIATTAGGIKLLRVYVLYKHGERELARLVHPSSVAGFGRDARYIRREGAYITWMFVMLFVLSIAAISLALSLCGLEFESAFVFAIASLSNTGPLTSAFGGELESYRELSDNARMYLDISMIIGRMEILAVVALLNTSLWRG